ncbi:DUF115 domain-containing protein [Treponema phagedenis]|uniref:Motility associated factor glycosyltransferase family protein n=1 Tax=Treponema phagedenis TaxID=162 RepID=A0A0B7GQG1_TREPH|nr:6-hydroxymethylpterin diphosphokinase MptE-like protein [Treponema phagedenis]NVP23336.1 motility associated factor glycosyltransferase family protein [Treponema phagedenis]QEJ95551.1 motility associated factor glycosyltransferase family protein [Treponema phagedenis]QEJ98443.1 motility associated factor glycosyltransferase family protein [Treponema phagedenis]QEK01404.1 motility associated factor glycosyltransferase family protein [Treponema phagedenis]QEK03951.1 motility associated factor
MNKIFTENIAALKKENTRLADILEKTESNSAYSNVFVAKSGELVPLLKNGKPLHSKYDPKKEAQNLLPKESCFVLFCGIGSGVQIKLFLETFPQAFCGVCEADYPTLRSAFDCIDFTEIIANKRLYFFAPISVQRLPQELAERYLPAMHGNFSVYSLSAWTRFFPEEIKLFSHLVDAALDKIRADYSVQAHFGKLWLRNAFINLQTAAKICPCLPKVSLRTQAAVLGAGPSLEEGIKKIQSERSAYTVFATDTAFPACIKQKLIPDFFIGIDPQYLSYAHSFPPLPKNTTAIFDLCACPSAITPFIENKNPLIFAAGGHPLAQLAAEYSPFPYMETSSGTVTIAALSVASSLGFTKPLTFGADFAYINGKPYARGTYLFDLYQKKAVRTAPAETSFSALMFRTQTKKITSDSGITYTTDVLTRYKKSFLSFSSENIWKKEDFSAFPYNEFIQFFLKSLKEERHETSLALLPFFAWYKLKKKKKGENLDSFSIRELVFGEILRYTKLK